jgi:hypothetical protein
LARTQTRGRDGFTVFETVQEFLRREKRETRTGSARELQVFLRFTER